MVEERISFERIKQVDSAYPTLNSQAKAAWDKILPAVTSTSPTDWEVLLFLIAYGGMMSNFYPSLMPYFKQLETHIQELHYTYPEEIYRGLQSQPPDTEQDGPIFRALAAIRQQQAERGVQAPEAGEASLQDQGSDVGSEGDEL